MKPIIILAFLLLSCQPTPAPWYEGTFVLPGKHPLETEIRVQITPEEARVNGISYGPPSVYNFAVGAVDVNSGFTLTREGWQLIYVDPRGRVFKGEVVKTK